MGSGYGEQISRSPCKKRRHQGVTRGQQQKLVDEATKLVMSEASKQTKKAISRQTVPVTTTWEGTNHLLQPSILWVLLPGLLHRKHA